MILRITKITSILLLGIYSISNAQVILQANKLPTVGDLWANKTITDTTIQPGPSGANQTWDFSTFFVYPSVISEQFISPTGAGNDALFPSANLKVNSFFGGNDYYLKSSNNLQYLGTKSSTNEIIITNAQQVLTTPFAYGDSIINPAVTGTGFGYALSGTIKVKADGWGSLTLFTGNFPLTLRVYSDANLVLGAGTGVDTYIQIQRYTWYAQNYKAPVFQISIIDVNGPLNTTHQKVTTVSTLATDIEEAENNIFQFNVSPNPSAAQVNLSVSLLRNSDVNFIITDMTGKIWKEEKSELTAGKNTIKMDLSILPKGIYSISAASGSLNREQRIVID